MSFQQLFDNQNRPLTITIFGWFLILGGLFTLYGLLSIINPEVMNVWTHMGINPISVIAVSLVSGIVNTGIGYGILNRQQKGKTLYLVYTPIAIIVSTVLLDNEFSMVILGVVVYILFSYLLFLPSSNAFFNGTYTVSEFRQKMKAIRTSQQRKSWVAKSFGVLFAFCTGLLLVIMVTTLIMTEQSRYPIAIIMFSVPAILFFVLSCVLWGWERWIAILGWTLSSFGAVAAYAGFSIVIFSSTFVWKLTDTADFDTQTFGIIGIVGLIPLGLGSLLIYLQYKNDRTSAGLTD